MPTQKFVILYESEKPVLPVNTFQFPINEGYEKENLRVLYDMLRLILGHLQFIPLDKASIPQDYNKMQENRKSYLDRTIWALVQWGEIAQKSVSCSDASTHHTNR